MSTDSDSEADRVQRLEAALAETRARLRAEEELRQRREREAAEIYDEMFRRNTAPKLLIDPETGAIADANPAALTFYGYTQEAMREQRIQDINQLSEEEVRAEWEKARREERRYFEFRHRLANGEIRDVKVYSGPVVMAGKTYLHSIIHDVTGATRYRQYLERYKAIFDTLPVGVYRNRSGPTGPFVEANPAAARIFGTESVAELLQHSTAELYRDPEQRRQLSAALQARGEIHRYEVDLQTLDDRPLRAAITARVHYDDQGEPVFDGVVEDITEHHRAELFRRRLLESLAEGVFGIDDAGRFTFFNPAARRLLGIECEDQVLGLNAHALTHHSRCDGSPLPESECPIREVQQTGTPLEAWEDCFWRRDGTSFSVEVFAAPLSRGNGGPGGLVVSFTDISERKALEQSLLKYRTAFEQSRDAIMFLDRNRCLEANPTALTMFGIDSIEAFQDYHPTELSPPVQPGGRASAEAAQARIEEAFEQGQAFFEWQHRRLDGQDFPAEVLLSRIDQAEPPFLQAVVRDISRRKEAEAARDQVLAILDATPDFVAANRPDGTMTYINRGGMALLGADAEGTGLDAPLPAAWQSWQEALERVHPEWARRRVVEEGIPAAEREGVWHDETALFDPEGREIPVSQIILAHHGDNGEVVQYSTIMRDISARRELEAKLRRETAFSEAMIRNLPGVFYMLDSDGRLVQWNERAARVTGRTPAQLEGVDALAFVPETERDRVASFIDRTLSAGSTLVETRLLTIEGETPYLLHGLRVELNGTPFVLGIGLDISRRKAMERELERLATHDSLTGLYNRAKLYELLQWARTKHERYATPFSVVLFDIDHFKKVNDRFGHQAGDEVLRELSRRVSAVLRETDAIARWGGEEFLVLATHTGPESAAALAERLREVAARSPFEGVGPVTISLGVASHQASETLKHLEARVDDALYAAKAAGRNRVVVAESQAG